MPKAWPSSRAAGKEPPCLEERARLRGYVAEKLRLRWSPAQISGQLREDFPGDEEMRVMQDQLNGRPRQTPGWKKPAEAFAELLEKVA